MAIAILLAAGSSTRMQNDLNKCLLIIKRKPILSYSLEKFEKNRLIDHIIVVTRKKDFQEILQIKERFSYKKIKNIVVGGASRQDSVTKGFNAALKLNPKQGDIIVMHNGANPFFTQEELMDVILYAKKKGTCGVAHICRDTVKEVRVQETEDRVQDAGAKVEEKGEGRIKKEIGFVNKTLERKKIVLMQTPQAIKVSLFQKALGKAKKDEFQGTDDLALVEHIGKPVYLIQAAPQNFKITDQGDLLRARAYLSDYAANYRIGIGLDSHRFKKKGKGMMLGGVYFSKEPKFEANSDGDVILHALYNAISSALGGDSLSLVADQMYQNSGITDSKKYLVALFKKHFDFEIINLAIVLEGARPKIEPLVSKIKKSLSEICRISKDLIGITATSGEGLDEYGRGEGLRCLVNVLLKI